LIFDGPSTLSGIEAALLAPMVDGVVLALKPIEDSSRDIQQSLKRLTLKRSDSVLGAVMLTDTFALSGKPERPRLPLNSLHHLLSVGPLRLLNPGKGNQARDATRTDHEPRSARPATTPSSHRDDADEQYSPLEAGIRTPRVIITPPTDSSQPIVTAPPIATEAGYERAVGEPPFIIDYQQGERRSAPFRRPPRRRSVMSRRRRG
jgi:hypothetical protein